MSLAFWKIAQVADPTDDIDPISPVGLNPSRGFIELIVIASGWPKASSRSHQQLSREQNAYPTSEHKLTRHGESEQ